MPKQNRDFPTVVLSPDNMPEGLIAFHAVMEDMLGGTEVKPIAAPTLADAAYAAQIWANENNMDVRTVTEFGWTEGLVGI